MRLARRPLLAGVLLALAVGGVAGCRTSPNVAAYVGDSQISVNELENAVDERLEDEAVAAYAAGQGDGYTRQVLGALVRAEVHAAAAERYGVEVTDRDVQARVDELLQGQDPDAVFEQLAAQGTARADALASVRQELIRQGIAEAEGLAEGLSEEELQARYEEVRDSLARVQLGFIAVPDAAIAETVLAQLTADPASYRELAARYAGSNTLAEPRLLSSEELPPPLAEAVNGTETGSGFTVPLDQTGAVGVGFVADRVVPTLEEARPQLEQQAREGANEAAAELVGEVREDLDVTVNPRYGVLEEEEIQPADGGVVDILEDEGGSAGDGGTGG